VDENACVRIPDDVPLELCALLGCAVLTGVGAVINAAHVQPGATVVVIGLGGVGLSALQGARLAGAERLIAVDRSMAKEPLARRCGATDVIEASADLAKQVRALTGGRGADHAIECVGSAETIRAAWSATRRGGDVTVVGMGGRDDSVSFNALEIPYFARTLRGCMYGSSDPRRDIVRLLEHVRRGRIDLETLVTARIGLDEVGEAFAALSRGDGGRSLVVFGS
jgi:S-(hydroxymethyl)glutathione dehydrogenase/alcohol dehydrogenase